MQAERAAVAPDSTLLEATERRFHLLRAGSVDINTVAQQMEAPFGGFKQSGVGRDRGSFGLYAYSEMQALIWPH